MGRDWPTNPELDGLLYPRRPSRAKGKSVSAGANGATISSVGTVHIRRTKLSSPDAARLIAALNAELTKMFPEPDVVAAQGQKRKSWQSGPSMM